MPNTSQYQWRCPNCNEPTAWYVTDSRWHPHTTSQHRRRKCRQCGVRISTYEITEPDLIRAWDKRRTDQERHEWLDKVKAVLEAENLL